MDAEGRVLLEHKIPVEACDPPHLTPDPTLVIVPLPWRTREHIFQTRGLKDDGVHDGWSDEDALAVLAAETAVGSESMLSTIGWCFLDEGDQRLGFYTLLLAAGIDWHGQPEASPAGDLDVRRLFRGLDQPATPLAHYLAAENRARRAESPAAIGSCEAPTGSFLPQIAMLHDLHLGWQQLERGDSGQKRRGRLERQTARFLKQTSSLPLSNTALTAVRLYGGDDAFIRVMDAAGDAFSDRTAHAFYQRLDHARAVARTGDAGRSRSLFDALLDDMLQAGVTPMIDEEIKTTFFADDKDGQAWNAVVRRITDALLAEEINPSALVIAWRLHQLDQRDAAERILAAVTASLRPRARLAWTLPCIAYLWTTDQRARAGAMLDTLLADEDYAEMPRLWRMAAEMAAQNDHLARAAECLERALDLECAAVPNEVNLDRIRVDYGRLLQWWADAADRAGQLDQHELQRWVGRIVRTADRWRSLDADSQQVCRLAAAALAPLGEDELAWDYATSPLAGNSEASIQWHERAREYHRAGRYALAQRAYALAFAAAPGNAEILWQHAQVLMEAGHEVEARQLFQLLTDGTWDPAYDGIKRLAEQALIEN